VLEMNIKTVKLTDGETLRCESVKNPDSIFGLEGEIRIGAARNGRGCLEEMYEFANRAAP
jgi:hypothetical protein